MKRRIIPNVAADPVARLWREVERRAPEQKIDWREHGRTLARVFEQVIDRTEREAAGPA